MTTVYVLGPDCSAVVAALASTNDVITCGAEVPFRERVRTMLLADRVILTKGWDKDDRCNVEQFIARCVGIPVEDA